MKAIEEIYPELNNTKNIVITMHQKPDGDALGSTLGLYHWLSAQGHNCTVIAPTNWPDFLNWLPACEKVIDFENQSEKATQITNEADLIFCLDFNTPSRLKNYETIVANAKAQKILIDHHQEPAVGFFAYGISDTSKSSTCEMVYDFITNHPTQKNINLDTAKCLYTGLMTDTGSFRFPATKSSSHKMAAHLLEIGVTPNEIHNAVYDTNTENKIRFLGHVLQNRMEIDYELNTALIAIPQSDLIKFDIKTGDTEGLVNYPLSILGIKLACIVIDRGDERKSSFRSKGNIDVNNFARQYFNGGGHFNASGGSNKEPLEYVVKHFKEKIKELKSQLTNYNF